MHQRKSAHVTISVDDTDPRERDSRCDRCGKKGTIARATRLSEPRLVLHYCATCWPFASKELQASQEEEQRRWPLSPDETTSPPPAWTSVSRSWHDVVQYLDLISEHSKGRAALRSDVLASIAAEIRATAGEMVGDMPPKVQAFVNRYSPPAA